MKSRNILILLFILAFAGTALSGLSQAQAQINLGDGLCSDDELNAGLCIRDECYVIEARLCDDDSWPCLETIDGVLNKVYKYRAQIAADVDLPCNCDTWKRHRYRFQICEV